MDAEEVAEFDIILLYNMFLQEISALIDKFIPSRTVTLKPKDPDFIAPLIKSLQK